MRGWEYPMLVLQLMFTLATDVESRLLPNEQDKINIQGTSYYFGDLKVYCLNALASLLEIMAYLQKDCFADFELICLNQLIANFRYQDYKLIKLKQDMNSVIDALKLQKEYELKLQKEYELEQQKQSKKEINIKLDNKKNENVDNLLIKVSLLENTVIESEKTVIWLREELINNIYPNTSYDREIMSLDIIKSLIEINIIGSEKLINLFFKSKQLVYTLLNLFVSR
jgi:hypothetical protein